jgi:putative DNA primase/helicase
MSIVPYNEPGRKSPEFSIPDADNIGKPLPEAWTRPVPGEEETSREHVHQASQQLVAAGLSVIPIEAYEGSKSPDTYRLPLAHDPVDHRRKPSWSAYQIRRPTTEELRRWYERKGSYGLAVLGGTVSGGLYGIGLEIIDIDTADLAKPWMEAVEREAPGLISSLVRIQTPRPGLHVYYRCSVYGVCQKLAFAPAVDDLGNPAFDAAGRPTRKTLIEVKAEGGYCLIPPSPARCHPSGRLYRYVEGSPTLLNIPTITPDERLILLKAARSLNQWKEPERAVHAPKSRAKKSGNLRPGDDFNMRANWADILIPHGWTSAGAYGEEERWCRPGKDSGISATTNHGGSGLLHVFSTNADRFDADGSYTKFAAYALLNHDGNFEEAARELAAQGYGKKTLKAGKR